jgi:putative acetyltransferase
VDATLAAPDVIALLQEHVAQMRATAPIESCHALDVDTLRGPNITFWTAREEATGALLGCGALNVFAPGHAEIKSMRTTAASKRRGVGRAVLGAILAGARQRELERVSLETGSAPFFEPAHALYKAAGFTMCPPFGEYIEDPHSYFMTLEL